MKKNKRELPFIQEVLVKIAGDFLQGLEWSLDMQKMFVAFHPEWHAIRRRKHRRQFEAMLRDAFWRLKKQGCITTRKKGKKLMITLTSKGSHRALREQMRRSERLPDGHYVLVFFDVPESARSVRKLFRHLLKESGFHQLQKSVWASNRAVFDHVKRFIETHEAGEWIIVCSTSVLFGSYGQKK